MSTIIFISLMNGIIAVHKNNELKLNGVKIMVVNEDMDVPKSPFV